MYEEVSTVKQLRELLSKFPDDMLVGAVIEDEDHPQAKNGTRGWVVPLSVEWLVIDVKTGKIVGSEAEDTEMRMRSRWRNLLGFS